MKAHPTSKTRKPTDADQAIAKNIKRKRLERGWSQLALAAELDVSAAQFARYERGINKLSIAQGAILARAFKCDINDFIKTESTDANTA